MVQQEVDEKTNEGADTKEQPKRRGVSRKDLPTVAYLLAHGDPATAHLPKTWKETIGFPLALFAAFFLSLLIFLHAPHSKSARRPFTLPHNKGRIVEPVKIPDVPISIPDEPISVPDEPISVSDEPIPDESISVPDESMPDEPIPDEPIAERTEPVDPEPEEPTAENEL
jgi:hypothetical protein